MQSIAAHSFARLCNLFGADGFTIVSANWV